MVIMEGLNLPINKPQEKENLLENNEILPAPEGWKTNKALSIKLNITKEMCPSFADKYRKDHPEYFKEFKDRTGNIREHYSPILINLITEDVEKNKLILQAPEGWKTNAALAVELKVGKPMVNKISEKYRKDNPEYFKEFKIKKGSVFEHYSPELLEIITQKVKEIPQAPEGWKTNNSIASESAVNFGFIKRITDNYRKDNPEYFKEFKNQTNTTLEHYSPELVEIITKEVKKFKEIPQAPEGWKTNTALADELNFHIETISNIANKYRKDNPEYFKEFKIKKGSVFEHYSPELLEIITQKVKEIPQAPEGWGVQKRLSLELQTNQSMIRTIANKYRKTNPEYFKEFKNKKNVVVEHCSPELVEIITKEVKKFKEIPQAPEGWVTNDSLAITLGVSPVKISRIVDNYRKTDPEYFCEFRTKTGILEHYSPQLIILATKEVKKFKDIPQAPEGWITNRALHLLLGVHPNTILKIANNYRSTNPEYFCIYKSETGNLREYYSLKLVEVIKKELEEKNININEAPENWQPKEDLSQKTGASVDDINKILAKYRKQFPDKFGKFKEKE